MKENGTLSLTSFPPLSNIAEEAHENVKIGKWRTILPQILVTTVNNFLLMDLSMMLAFPTLVIGDLYMSRNELSLDDTQASWVGSLVYIFQPIGSSVSGIITEPMGRKLSMILVNITPLVGWLMTGLSNSVTMLYISNAIMGLGIGFMEAPVLTYVGEISQPSIRGMLTAYTGVLAQLGYLLVYLLGALMHWRTAAFASVSIPLLSALCMLWIPESPMWLLARGRDEEALAALCWLRGWVPPECVQEEFQEMKEYAEATKKLIRARCGQSVTPEQHDNLGAVFSKEELENVSGKVPTPKIDKVEKLSEFRFEEEIHVTYCMGKYWPLLSRIRDLFRRETLHPMMMVTLYFLVFHASGMSGVRPYMVHIIEEFQMPFDTHWAAVVTAVLGLAAILTLTGFVRKYGKRALSHTSIIGCSLSCLVLGTYAQFYISKHDCKPCDEFMSPEATVTDRVDINQNFTTFLLPASVTKELFNSSFNDINNLETSTHPNVEVKAEELQLPITWLPLAALITLSFFTYLGVGQIPWMYVAEVFPFKSRGLASGVVAAFAYVLYFTAANTYLNLRNSIGLNGVFWLYGFLGIVGFLYLHFVVPETEGMSLDQVELLFNPKKRKYFKQVNEEQTSRL